MNDQPTQYRVGLAQTDITPPVGIRLTGFAARVEPSTGVYLPLRAVAVAIDDGVTPLLVLSAEWIGFYDLTEAMRRQLTAALGIPAEQIVLTGTHTHCGPAIHDFDWARGLPLDTAYRDQAMAAMVRCAQEAWANRTPARLRVATGRCSVAMCRRKPDGQGGVLRAMTPYPAGASDHDVPVVAVESLEGELRGILFSYACHPTSRGGLLIGGDFIGFAYDHLDRQHPGVISCFLQGCAGDQKARPVDPDAEAFGGREVEQVRDIGEELGQAVDRALASEAFEPITGPVRVAQQFITLETELTPPAELEASLQSPTPYVRQWAQHQLDRAAQGEPVSPAIPFEIQTLRFGNTLAVVTLAAEMTVEYGLRLKRELGPHFRHVLPLAYTNDIIGYVPAARQRPDGGYEVIDANQYWRRTGPFRLETEDQIHTAVHAMLEVPVADATPQAV